MVDLTTLKAYSNDICFDSIQKFSYTAEQL